MATVDVNLTYPYSKEYEYTTRMVRIDMDQERINDLSSDNGFIIAKPKGIRKDLKEPVDSIFSSRFGQSLKDMNPFADRFKCECGYLKSAINNNSICPVCGTRCQYVGDNFSYYGWLVLRGEDHYVIHPALYKSIESFIGKNVLKRILEYKDYKDADGHDIEQTIAERDKHADEPFFGIGMIEFRKRFDEIMDYYSKQYKNKSKKDYYDDIMQDRDKVFTQSIPVFTTLLRPVDPNASSLYYESTNGLFYMMSRLTWELNEFAEKKMKGKSTSEHQLLYDLQVRYTKLCDEIDEIMQGKKGAFRSLLAGRYNFSSRCVIVPNPKLRIDQVMLPYAALVELLQQRIVNIIQKSYNKSYADAYDIWYRATIQPDTMIKNIIQTIIDNSCDGQGIPLIINRNPTIAYGGIMQMFCIGMNDAYVMEVPLQILPPLAAKQLATYTGM